MSTFSFENNQNLQMNNFGMEGSGEFEQYATDPASYRINQPNQDISDPNAMVNTLSSKILYLQSMFKLFDQIHYFKIQEIKKRECFNKMKLNM